MLAGAGFPLSVLAVGTAHGGPVPTAGGAFAKTEAGEIVVARTDFAALERLAEAGGGRFQGLQCELQLRLCLIHGRAASCFALKNAIGALQGNFSRIALGLRDFDLAVGVGLTGGEVRSAFRREQRQELEEGLASFDWLADLRDGIARDANQAADRR